MTEGGNAGEAQGHTRFSVVPSSRQQRGRPIASWQQGGPA